jgi:hypothetical protein
VELLLKLTGLPILGLVLVVLVAQTEVVVLVSLFYVTHLLIELRLLDLQPQP